MATKRTDLTTIQISAATRDRLYRLKFRKTYDDFLRELCDLYENPGRTGQDSPLRGSLRPA